MRVGEAGELRLLRDVLALAAPPLTARPRQLPGQLTGRLGGPDGAPLVALADGERRDRQRWLRPRHPTLTGPGGPLQRIIRPGGTLSGTVTALAALPGRTRVAVGTSTGSIEMWDTDSGRLVDTLASIGQRVHALEVPPGGERLVSSSDGGIDVWDLPTGQFLAHHPLVAPTLVAHPDGRTLFGGGHAMDLETGRSRRLPALGRRASLAVNPDARQLAVGAAGACVRVVDLSSAGPPVVLEGQRPQAGISSLAYSPDGRRLFAGHFDGSIREWDPASGEQRAPLVGHTALIRALLVTGDGHWLLSASGDTTVRAWALSDLRQAVVLTGHGDEVWSLAELAGARIASGSADGSVRIWAIDRPGGSPSPFVQDRPIVAAAITPAAGQVVFASEAPTQPGSHVQEECGIRVWRTSPAEPESELAGHPHDVASLALSPDGQTLVSCGSWDGSVITWNLATGDVLARWTMSTGSPFGSLRSVAFLPGGERVLVTGGSVVGVWDPLTWKQVDLIELDAQASAVVPCPDGTTIVVGGADGALERVDLETGAFTRMLLDPGPGSHGGAVLSSAVSALVVPDRDDVFAFTGHRNGELRAWGQQSGVQAVVRLGASCWATAAATLDEHLLVVGRSDGRVEVREATSLAEVADLDLDGPVTALDVSAESGMVVAGDATGRIHLLTLEARRVTFGPGRR